MDHHRAVLQVRRLDPEADRERLEPVEVAQGKRDVVLAAELQGLADPARDELRALENLTGFRGIGPVLDLQVLDLVERELADLPAQDRAASGTRGPAPGARPRTSAIVSCPAARARPPRRGSCVSAAAIARSVSSVDRSAVGVGTASVKCE